jgi:hypothetical protein
MLVCARSIRSSCALTAFKYNLVFVGMRYSKCHQASPRKAEPLHNWRAAEIYSPRLGADKHCNDFITISRLDVSAKSLGTSTERLFCGLTALCCVVGHQVRHTVELLDNKVLTVLHSQLPSLEFFPASQLTIPSEVTLGFLVL